MPRKVNRKKRKRSSSRPHAGGRRKLSRRRAGSKKRVRTNTPRRKVRRSSRKGGKKGASKSLAYKIEYQLASKDHWTITDGCKVYGAHTGNDIKNNTVYDGLNGANSFDASLNMFSAYTPKDIYTIDTVASDASILWTGSCSIEYKLKNCSNVDVEVWMDEWVATRDIPITADVANWSALLTFSNSNAGGTSTTYRQQGWDFFQSPTWCHYMHKRKRAHFLVKPGVQQIMSVRKTKPRQWQLDYYDFQATPDYLAFKGTVLHTFQFVGGIVNDATNAYKQSTGTVDVDIEAVKIYEYYFMNDANQVNTYVDNTVAPGAGTNSQTIDELTGAVVAQVATT
nr:MAG: capsid protein [Cressdnaviricota sp.]